VHFHHLLHVGAEALMLVRRIVPRARIVFTLHDFHPICANAGLMVKASGGALCHGASPDACHACFPELPADRFALRRLHLNNMLGIVDLFVTPSQTVRDKFVAWGIDPVRIACVKGGVPAPGATENEATRLHPSRFAFFGTIAPHKGVLVALDAVARLSESSDATLSLHGDDTFQTPEFRDSFSRAMRRARGRAVHDGAYDRADLDRLMGAVDWVVVPSTWWENAPLVILEAFARRRPVIAADVGGMAELVRHGHNGLLFRRGNPSDLAQLMTRAAEEPGLWASLRANIDPVPTMAHAASAYAHLYRDLMDSLENERKRA
jgi:glycosyltransferase involved in cell wall biosynthesis